VVSLRQRRHLRTGRFRLRQLRRRWRRRMVRRRLIIRRRTGWRLILHHHWVIFVSERCAAWGWVRRGYFPGTHTILAQVVRLHGRRASLPRPSGRVLGYRRPGRRAGRQRRRCPRWLRRHNFRNVSRNSRRGAVYVRRRPGFDVRRLQRRWQPNLWPGRRRWGCYGHPTRTIHAE
jgi:hypothetical protein